MSDLISRQAAIDAISCDITITGRQNAELVAATIGTFADRIKALPSAQPDIDEWCTDCSEYDHDKHCCPRFNRVIRSTLEDAQPTIEPKHIHVNLEVTKIGKHVPKFDFDEQPERKTGRWIVWKGMDIPENHGKHKCSECREFASTYYDKPIVRERLTNYCPHCGAKMEVEHE